MMFYCFGNPIVDKRFCVFFSIFFICVATIMTLTGLLIFKYKANHHVENNEITITMASNSTDSTIMDEITTDISTDLSKTLVDYSLFYWTNDSYLTRPRAYYDAVLFPNGKVLACGGYINSTFVTLTCDIYSSSIGWMYQSSMKFYRYYYTLTIFADNTKALAAGTRWTGYQQTAEVYDSTTNKWAYTTTNMSTTRRSHAAILLKNEQILIMGGKSSSGTVLSSAELFIPSSNSFIITSSMNMSRVYFTSTLLSDGSTVLVTGGIGADNITTATAELYISGSWIRTNNNMIQGRAYHAAVLLQDGNVLIAGGGDGAFISFSTAESYNSITHTFTSIAPMNYRRALFTLTLLPSGKVLATGGVDWSTYTYPIVCELYDPISQTWSNTRMLNIGRSSHISVLLNDSVLMMGGVYDGFRCLASCEKYYL